jgi:hypothetical protein
MSKDQRYVTGQTFRLGDVTPFFFLFVYTSGVLAPGTDFLVTSICRFIFNITRAESTLHGKRQTSQAKGLRGLNMGPPFK